VGRMMQYYRIYSIERRPRMSAAFENENRTKQCKNFPQSKWGHLVTKTFKTCLFYC
jgi:hypothetical protein